MSAHRRPDPGEIIPRVVWRDAEHRLLLMEDRARAMIQRGARMTRIVVTVDEPHRLPILLPARIGEILLGPDGRPLKEEP